MDEMEVVEGERRGDSTGETSAVEGYEASESVVEVIVLLRIGFLAPARLDDVAVAEAIMVGREEEGGQGSDCWSKEVAVSLGW
jgi:hypothetical protein